MKVDFLASAPHYADHLRPVYDALPPENRGQFLYKLSPRSERLVVVASGTDSRTARFADRRTVRMEHGIGQSYPDAPGHESYPGAVNQDHVVLFLPPNEPAAQSWLDRYPNTRTVVVGCPKLDARHLAPPKTRNESGVPTVCVSFHWDCRVSPATRSAFWEFREAVEELMERDDIELLGHAHPVAEWMQGFWEEAGVRFAPHFDEVMDRADLYCVDNSSTLFEFASLDRPCVRLKGRHQRPYDYPYMGVAIVTDPASLDEAIDWALEDDERQAERRRLVTSHLYPYRGRAAQTAAAAILAVL